MVKVDTNPCKVKVNVANACFNYEETQPMTFKGLEQHGKPTMLRFAKDKHVMLKVAFAHRVNEHIVPYVRLLGYHSI